jgi:uncharacterized protein YjlB
MPILEDAKRLGERLSGLGRPQARELPELVRQRKASTLRFKDDGLIPNHPSWPLILYRGPVRLGAHDPAAVMEVLFETNGWGDCWRNGIYPYAHYHSRIHEVLGIARGSANVQFGGAHGRTVKLKAGDVAVLPAGTGHQCLAASEDFLVVGAYPPAGTYDECTTIGDHPRTVKTIPKVGVPRKDPVYGSDGPLRTFWKKKL